MMLCAIWGRGRTVRCTTSTGTSVFTWFWVRISWFVYSIQWGSASKQEFSWNYLHDMDSTINDMFYILRTPMKLLVQKREQLIFNKTPCISQDFFFFIKTLRSSKMIYRVSFVSVKIMLKLLKSSNKTLDATFVLFYTYVEISGT